MAIESKLPDIKINNEMNFNNANIEKIVNIEKELDSITGLSMTILFKLLTLNDYSTFLSSLQGKLNLNRSTFYYTVNKLEKHKLINVKTTATMDQRKKTISLSPEGINLLNTLYSKLRGNVEQQKLDKI